MGEAAATTGGTGKIRKLWIGVHVAADVHFFGSGNDVCSLESMGNQKYSCYYQGTTVPVQDGYAGAPYGIPKTPGAEGKISGGAKLATIRVMLSGDYAVIPNLTVGGRLGFAFNGGPKGATYAKSGGEGASSTYSATQNKAFLPVHAEGRLAYWFKSLGQPGIRPYVAVGGGLAQVDAKITVPILTTAGPQNVDVYKRLGQGFITLAPGAVFPLSANMGVQANLNIMYMLPVSGIVLEPSVGAVIGF
jgi:hypothetical protein